MIAKLSDDLFLQSNAMNFMSFLTNGVDARTGQYSMRLELPPVHANGLRDIDFPLVMLFNSMSNQDTGYGTNWQLQHTRFTPADSMLTLASGETYKVTADDPETGQLLMREKKLDSFHLYRHGDGYRIVHRSGLVEVLGLEGSGSNRAFVPKQVVSPLGHVLRLRYEHVSGGFMRLKAIHQADGEPVFSTELGIDNILSLNYFPDALGGPGASYKMHLTGAERTVKKIELPSHDQGAWDFDYQQMQGLWCMQKVTTPNGGEEQILYLDEGHLYTFKDGNGQTTVGQIPRVTHHLVTPGLGQPAIDTRYTYPNDPDDPKQYNFLGYTLDIDWARENQTGLDAMYQHIGDYSYGSVETLYKDDKPVRSIERRFNQFHLQTLEKTTQGNKVAQTATLYGKMLKGVPFDDQPRTFQLATQTSRLWYRKGNSPLRGAVIESTRYDGQGNVLEITKANGVKEINTWYPAEASPGHPKDPEGFDRHLKERRIIPAGNDGDTLVQRYTYATRDALVTPDYPDLQPCHLVDSETLVAVDSKGNETELEKVQYSYTDDLTNPFQHGRVSMRTTLRDANMIMSTFEYTHLDTLALVRTTETTMGLWDAQTATQVSLESTRTGLLHEQHDQDGIVTRYEYDLLGRVTLESVTSADGEFPAERSYAYYLRGATDNANAEPPGQKLTDALGTITRTYVDGLGRPVRVARDKIDNEAPKRLHDTHALSYDEWGNKASETRHDWYLGKQKSRVTRYQYDDWGQLTRTINPEGTSLHEEINPIGTVEHTTGAVIRRWTSGSDGQVASRVETWMNLFDKPVRTQRMDSEWKALPGHARLQAYDGLGRCTKDTNERGYSTVYTYDAYDRVTSTLLPDATLLEQAYASHSTEALPISLTVTPEGKIAERKQIASQQFDSLQRLVSRTMGERTETYAFTGGRSQPDSYTTPAGATIKYEYDLALTLAPKTSLLANDDFNFKYNPITGNLLEASNTIDNESGKRSYGYNEVGQLTSETWTGPDGKKWKTSQDISSTGLPHSHLQANNVETTYEYDDHLRLESSTQGLVKVGYQYDTQGRPWKITTEDTASGGATQVTEIEYDDYGHENKRTETVAGQPTRIVTQLWGKDDLLDERTVKHGDEVQLHEVFIYDPRQRLTTHQCSGSQLPKDPFGQPYTELTMPLDGYNNIKTTQYKLEGIEQLQRAAYSYRKADPCQLESISYIPTGPKLTFSYDKNGHMRYDQGGFVPEYNARGRLTAVKDENGKSLAKYRYDALNELYASEGADEVEQLLFFEENRLSVAVRGAQVTHLLYAAEQPVAQQLAGVADDTTLLQTSASGSVLCELRKGKMTTFSYAAYGDSSPSAQGMLGYNGAMRDAATGWYLMGQNYRRPLDVGLGRWLLPDSLSFFDGGPLNPYVYCDANPVVFRDPTGHAAEGWGGGRLRRPDEDNPHAFTGGNSAGGNSLDAWLSIGISAVFLVLGVISFGSALPAAFATGATVAAIISAVSLGAATIIETVALGLVIGGYVTESDGLMRAGQFATYGGIAIGAPASLIQAYKALRGIAKWIKGWGKPPATPRGSVSSMGSAGSVSSTGSAGSVPTGGPKTNLGKAMASSSGLPEPIFVNPAAMQQPSPTAGVTETINPVFINPMSDPSSRYLLTRTNTHMAIKRRPFITSPIRRTQSFHY
jgi:RHS repeat-associated protein